MTELSNIIGTGNGELRIPAGVDATTDDQKDMYRASLEFERFFLSHLMKGMDEATKALKGDDDSGDGTTTAYNDMARDQLTQALLDGGGVGLAAMIYNQISGNQTTNGVVPPTKPAIGNEGGNA